MNKILIALTAFLCINAFAQPLSAKTTRQVCNQVGNLAPFLYYEHEKGTSQQFVEFHRVRLARLVEENEISSKLGGFMTNLLYWTDVEVSKVAPVLSELETTKRVVALCAVDPLAVVSSN